MKVEQLMGTEKGRKVWQCRKVEHGMNVEHEWNLESES